MAEEDAWIFWKDIKEKLQESDKVAEMRALFFGSPPPELFCQALKRDRNHRRRNLKCRGVW